MLRPTVSATVLSSVLVLASCTMQRDSKTDPCDASTGAEGGSAEAPHCELRDGACVGTGACCAIEGRPIDLERRCLEPKRAIHCAAPAPPSSPSHQEGGSCGGGSHVIRCVIATREAADDAAVAYWVPHSLPVQLGFAACDGEVLAIFNEINARVDPACP
jgi:hypothetical protein